MNTDAVVAPVNNSQGFNPAQPRIVKVTKPQGDQSITLELGSGHDAKIDLSAIANERMTLVHVGTKLVILFDNQSTVTVESFFDSSGKPFAFLEVELGAGRAVTGEQFSALFPITEDQSVLLPAGNGQEPSAGAYLNSPSVGSVGLLSVSISPPPPPPLGQEEESVTNFDLASLTQRLIPQALQQRFNPTDGVTAAPVNNPPIDNPPVNNPPVNDPPVNPPINNAPVNTVPGAQTVNEDQSLIFQSSNLNSIAVFDVDGGTETATLSVLHGVLTLGSISGLSGLSGNNSATVSFTGTLAQINAALDGLTYRPDDNYNGPDVLTVTTSDGSNADASGFTAAVTSGKDTDFISIDVVPVNDPPVAVADTIYVSQSTNIVVPLSLLAANDSDLDGNALNIIETSNIAGIGGSPIATQLPGDGTVTFTTPASGNDDGSFSYKLSDGHSEASGIVTVHELAIKTTGKLADDIDMSDRSYQFAFLDTAAGDDKLTLGSGVDHFVGGAGFDIFIVAALAALNASDTIDGIAEASTTDTLKLGAAGTYDLATFDIANIDLLVLSKNAAGFSVVVGDAMVSTADLNMDGIGGDLEISSDVSMNKDVMIDGSSLTGSNHIIVDGKNFNGDDTLKGGAGGDLLAGGKGSDTLTGGAGADHFSYISRSDGGTIANQSGADHIVDFNAAQGDIIDILGSAFGNLAPGANVAAIFGSSETDTFGSSSERFHFNIETHTLLYDSNGSNSNGVQAALAVFEDHAIVAATNIHII